VVYAQGTDDKDLALAENSNKAGAEEFLSQIKIHFLKESA
jgi:hypothetical protein